MSPRDAHNKKNLLVGGIILLWVGLIFGITIVKMAVQ